MNAVHKITGYDRLTEALTYAFDLSGSDLDDLRQFTRVGPNDPSMLASYPLDRNSAAHIAHRLRLPMKLEACDWFIEPFAV